jgi:hypothetical protein
MALSARTAYALSSLEAPDFLRAMEEDFSTSPLFGIFSLKRLSRAGQRVHSPSRETLNAHQGTVVKAKSSQFFAPCPRWLQHRLANAGKCKQWRGLGLDPNFEPGTGA